MLKSCWIIAVVIGLAFSQSLQAQEQTSPTEDRAIHLQELLDQKPSGIPIRIIEDSDARDARERSDREREQREKADLEAQQGMNAATKAMNDATQSIEWATWLSTFFVAVGTALLVWTLILTRQANKSAQTAVEITRDIGRLQTRAYLDICDAKVTNLKVGHVPTIQIAIKNCGQSPARNLRVRSTVGFINTDPDTIKLRHGIMNPSTSIIGSGVTSYLTVKLERTLSADDIKGFDANEYHFVVGLSLRYETVFSQVRRAVFRLVSHNTVFVSDKEMVPLKASHRNNRSN